MLKATINGLIKGHKNNNMHIISAQLYNIHVLNVNMFLNIRMSYFIS